MNRRARIGALLGLLVLDIRPLPEEPRSPLRLRPVAPKRFYRPGEWIHLQIRCDPGFTGEVIVFFNPGAADEGGVSHPPQKCPRSRFRLRIPEDYTGPASVGVMLIVGEEFYADRFHFEVRSARKSGSRTDPTPAAPTPAPARPTPAPLTVAEFLASPDRLRGHPADVGQCRLVEHWTTGYCYIYSTRRRGKVSEATDVACERLPELRLRMKAAIEAGYCDGPADRAAEGRLLPWRE